MTHRTIYRIRENSNTSPFNRNIKLHNVSIFSVRARLSYVQCEILRPSSGTYIFLPFLINTTII